MVSKDIQALTPDPVNVYPNMAKRTSQVRLWLQN